MYIIRYKNLVTNKIYTETYCCWCDAIKNARFAKEIFKCSVEIYEPKEVI